MSYSDEIKKLNIKKDAVILAIESSCDETCASVTCGRELLSNEIISSAEIQKKYGGVVPEIASRYHTDAIDKVVKSAMEKAKVSFFELDAVAVTYGAGLLGALLVGLSYAKALAFSLNIPIIPVSHIHGHLSVCYLVDKTLEPPFISLLASGGHTAVIKVGCDGEYEILGSTLDDAVGEAFDKVARVLDLSYPGGPNVERLATLGKNCVPMPKMLKGQGGYNFSYSGLKTAVINYVHSAKMSGREYNKCDVASSFQSSALDILVEKTIEGAKSCGINTVTAGGGVCANGYLRDKLKSACDKNGLRLVIPDKHLCTDNAAMIASEGYRQYLKGNFAPLSLNAKASLSLK